MTRSTCDVALVNSRCAASYCVAAPRHVLSTGAHVHAAGADLRAQGVRGLRAACRRCAGCNHPINHSPRQVSEMMQRSSRMTECKYAHAFTIGQC